ncbi:Alpha/Beta hydrolase protein [Immersiella caudata]|uniref:Alpha/Beta hydrolase protein n=1 Tax=Immersiella caudata TaxID=314043 RepID=A0AA39WPI4_9PEZI|nr:Alpha/Beta hydrolase protein [Immersiella caudata]
MSKLVALVLLSLAAAQFPPAVPHLTSFNSSFTFTPEQVSSLEIDANLTITLQNIIRFENTQLAFGGPHHDAFYTPPPLNTTTPPPPGTLLSLQAPTDYSAYTIPPLTSLSRLLYTTTTYNGTIIPTSAFLLLPYLPRPSPPNSKSAGKIPLVLWTHGTSGFFPSATPSSHRGLWYETSAVYPLVEAGYAVFAPDYAGLGVGFDWDGNRIRHQYHAAPAQVGDVLYGLLAVREAFPGLLSEEFVVVGHSQGGGVAWAVAEALADEKGKGKEKWEGVKGGYRGTVAVSPTTDAFNGDFAPETFIAPTVGQAVATVFPGFTQDKWLTELGVNRWGVVEAVEGGIAVVQRLFFGQEGVLKKGWNETWEAKAFRKLMTVGGKKFAGPLLIVQGDEDVYVPYEGTRIAVEKTWEVDGKKGDLEFYVAEGVGHVPALHAGQVYWLKWIGERFDGKGVRKGGFRTDVKGLLPKEWYQKFKYAFPLWTALPEFQYETAAAL